MRGVVKAAAIVLAVGVLAACARPAGAPEPAASPAESAADRPALPAGWRWESFGGVQVGVPGDWGWDNQAIRLDAWCVKPGDHPPAVARPGGPIPAIACGGGTNGTPPGSLIANTGWTVGFGRTDQSDGITREGDRTTVRRDSVEVIVQAPEQLRDRIVATVHRVTVDDAGCPVTHQISTGPDLRPAPPADVTALHDVTSLSACKYPLPEAGPGRVPPRLLSGLRLDGAAAADEVRRIAAAPAGSGDLDTPADCLPEAAHGNEIIVLLVRSATGLAEMTMRYAGCVQNGFDDGTTVRRLTKAAVAPLVAGPNRIYGGFSGPPEKADLLLPHD
ncbi:hypothetical protein [Actinoplanes cyaneus]|uniref:hypothetical protein n=1 Tax=Actinoplanes cyaneus TaxID=52696 RepID=UPI0019451B5F|nr:hypothetical protein [Actinoplanes cyaneus]MCW2140177.1 hypothetical protein [Actinoplanes cyaneus]